MSASSQRSFVSPVLTGRAMQVGYLRRQLQRPESPRTVVLSGEAGIGKSRLARETRSIAEETGYEVVQGSCFEHDGHLPYSAFIDLLRTQLLHRSVPDLEALLSSAGPEIAKLVPELALHSPKLVPTPPLDAEQEKRRIFHAVSQVLLKLSGERPVLAIFEDLHWADEVTLELLLHFSRRLAEPGRSPGALLLLTYRSDETAPALSHALAELERMRLAVEMRLSRLTIAETDVMIRAILDLNRPVRREYLQRLHEVTEGNPFFTEELLKSTNGDALDTEFDRTPLDQLDVPRTVRDLVQQRCRRLDERTRTLLDLAAVAGQRFELPVIQLATGANSADLLSAMKELVSAQLVVEEAPDSFHFRHALTREAVYSELLSTERRDRHRQLLGAIELLALGSQQVSARLGDLAYHSYEAEDWEKAIEYCIQAGLRAQELFSPKACVQHLTRAIEAARRLGRPMPAPVLRTRARAYELSGDFNRAMADLQTALELAQRSNDRSNEWEALVSLGSLWSARDYGRAGKYFTTALEVARLASDEHLFAHSLNRVGNWLMNVGDPPGALARHEEALSAFRALGDREGTASTLDLLGMTSYHSVKLTDQARFHQQAVELFRELGDRQSAISSLSLLAINATSYEFAAPIARQSDFEDSVRAGETALQEAIAIGWRAGEAFACYALGLALGTRGRYGRALTLAGQCLRIAEEIEHKQWTVAAMRLQGELEHDLLLFERAVTSFKKGLALANEIKSSFWIAALSAALARALTALGRLEEASTFIGPYDAARPPVLATWLGGWANAELALATGDFNTALDLSGVLSRAAWPEGRGSQLSLLQAKAALGLNRFDAAEELLNTLLTVPVEDSSLPLRWRAFVLSGHLLDATGRKHEARARYALARAVIQEAAASIDDEALRRDFVERAYRRLPRSRPGSSERLVAKTRFDGLTEREREVATLIALGRSNREIAGALFLSVRTVAVHVTNILSKLGFSSRAQIAGWATAKGMSPAISRPES